MPELPEVETTLQGITPHVLGQRISALKIRERRLRWPISPRLAGLLAGQRITHVTRRGKYLLLATARGTLIMHLGMSGSLRIVPAQTPAHQHDHVDIVLASGACVRLRDPRRFGALVWSAGDPLAHPLLRDLGPEPLDETFSGDYLVERARGRRVAIKQFLMDSKVVVGVGNIYANEALFAARIHPLRPAGRISARRYAQLAHAIKEVLRNAIQHGGTTLRDFTRSDGRPGYFRMQLAVYEHAGEPCVVCGAPIKQIRQGQRSTFYCPHCQR